MFVPDASPVGLLPVSRGHVSTDYEVTSAANGRTMILTRETRACNPSLATRVVRGTVDRGPGFPNKQ